MVEGLSYYIDDVQMPFSQKLKIVGSALGTFDSDSEENPRILDWRVLVSERFSSESHKYLLRILGEQTVDMLMNLSLAYEWSAYICTGISDPVDSNIEYRMENGYEHKDKLALIIPRLKRINRIELEGVALDDNNRIHQTRKQIIGRELRREIDSAFVYAERRGDSRPSDKHLVYL